MKHREIADTPLGTPTKSVPSIVDKVRLVRGDSVLWVITIFLMVISLLAVYSSTAKMGYNPRMGGTTSSFLTKHILTLIASGCIILLIYRVLNCNWFRWLTWPAYIFAMICTGLVYVSGASTNSAERWLDIGLFSFQPSEVLKIATVMLLAQQLATRQNQMDKIKILPLVNPLMLGDKREWQRWWADVKSGTLPILMPLLAACSAVILSHFSTTVILFVIGVAMMIVGRVKLVEIAKLIVLGIIAVALMLMVFTKIGRGTTAVNRITTWYETITTDTSTKVNKFTDSERSVVAIHDGGAFGLGAGRSIMRPRITHPESDYMFAIFVEEYGIIMAFFLILLYMWIFFRAMRIFEQCGWVYAGLLVVGLAMLTTGQALMHIIVTINFMPETGQNLPFITQSATSMACSAAAMGMMLCISRQIEEGTLVPPRSEKMVKKVE